MTSRTVLVDVDVQNDFCLADGALAVPGSPNALYARIVALAERERWPIVGSVDSHAFDAWEFASNGNVGPSGEDPRFPDHCVKGTRGWLKVEGTLPKRFRFAPCVPNLPHDALAAELARGDNQGLYFEKEVYSLFANPSAEAVLGALRLALEADGGRARFVVFGVATDYCVRAAALGLASRGYETVVLTDAIRGITEEGTRAALEEMRAAGARLANAREALGASLG
ncbi:MAG: isochorismatase family protein [Polyangiaceae bacterium]